jgi:hypothetical protein
LAYDGVTGKIVFVLLAWLVVVLLVAAHLCMRLKIGSADDCIGYTATASVPQTQPIQ